MAWTTPVTAVAGNVLTASFWNEQVRDNTSDLRSYQNRYARAKRTSGSITSSSATWENVDTNMDLVLNASAGDVVEVSLSGIWDAQALSGFLDAVSVVSGNPVNSFGLNGTPSNSHIGIGPWGGATSVSFPMGGNFFRTLVAGDISGGTVTIRLRRRNASAASKQLFATTDIPLEWWARNHGPVTT